MMHYYRYLAIAVFALSACLPLSRVSAEQHSAPTLADLQRTVERLTKVVEEQQRRIDELERRDNTAPELPPTQLSTAGDPVNDSKGRRPVARAFNPDIGVVADIVATSTESREDDEGNDTISVRHLELALGHDVDPYSRLDATIAFSDTEDVHLEEAYLTHFGLPGSIRARIGRIRPRIGIAATLHRDSLDAVDEPLWVTEYFGAEGWNRTGIETSVFAPLPWEEVTHEVIVGILEGGIGEEGTLLGSTRRRPTPYARMRNFWEISDISDMELNATFLMGSSDEDSSYEVRGFAVDTAWIRHLPGSRRLKFMAEAFFQDRSAMSEQDEDLLVEDQDVEFRESPIGVYALLDYRFAGQFGAGTRWDYVEAINHSDEEIRTGDMAWSAYLTFYQSEYARWRAQYQHVDFAEGGSDDRAFLQGTFAIGTHKHQIR
ncbi:MAG: hypothetical protein QY326_02630 [Bdellovibrionota bacterium]|nr:MAG: hypothetical protein QY326_02630 [Bdellovibrionota bacterium]